MSVVEETSPYGIPSTFDHYPGVVPHDCGRLGYNALARTVEWSTGDFLHDALPKLLAAHDIDMLIPRFTVIRDSESNMMADMHGFERTELAAALKGIGTQLPDYLICNAVEVRATPTPRGAGMRKTLSLFLSGVSRRVVADDRIEGIGLTGLGITPEESQLITNANVYLGTGPARQADDVERIANRKIIRGNRTLVFGAGAYIDRKNAV